MVDFAVVGDALPRYRFKVGFCESGDFIGLINARLVEFRLEPIYLLRRCFFSDPRSLIILREGFPNLARVVNEIENEGVSLKQVDAIQARLMRISFDLSALRLMGLNSAGVVRHTSVQPAADDSSSFEISAV